MLYGRDDANNSNSGAYSPHCQLKFLFFSFIHQNPIITTYSPSETIKICFLDHSFVLRWRLNSRRTLLYNLTYCSVPQCWKRSSLRKTCINWIACSFVFVSKTILLIISSINGDFTGLLNELHWIDNSINSPSNFPNGQIKPAPSITHSLSSNCQLTFLNTAR